ncbi:hypothetical protein Agub_g10910 [Astrephomene gubernaculifera]|uniref:Uncharacterized protein n=1 Tax=Astrephomene gubernaculifera TaxID=47775 RepID=A0AAD3HPK4_9CHLO|nr:hypothetical protein Agub_g10910 [Astrephomene gubernaculifera]
MASPLSILGEPFVGIELVAAADARSIRGLAGNPQDAKVIARFTWHRSLADARVRVVIPPSADDATAWEPIPGATRPMYRCTADDVGRWLRATVVPLVATAGGRGGSSAGGEPPGPRPVLRAVAGPVSLQPTAGTATTSFRGSLPVSTHASPRQRAQPQQQPQSPPRPQAPQHSQPPSHQQAPQSPPRLVVEGQYTAVAEGASRLLVALSPTHLVADEGDRQPLPPPAAAAAALRAPASPERSAAAAGRAAPSYAVAGPMLPQQQQAVPPYHPIGGRDQPHWQQPQQQQQPVRSASAGGQSHARGTADPAASMDGGLFGPEFALSPDRLRSSNHWEEVVGPLLGSPPPVDPTRQSSPLLRQGAAAAAATAQVPGRRAAKTDPGGLAVGPPPPVSAPLEELLNYAMQFQEQQAPQPAAPPAHPGSSRVSTGGLGGGPERQPAAVSSQGGAPQGVARPPQARPPQPQPQSQQHWRGPAGGAAEGRYPIGRPPYPGGSSGGGASSSGMESVESSGYFREGAMPTPFERAPQPAPLHPGQPLDAAAARGSSGGGGGALSPLPPQRLDRAFYALRASADQGSRGGGAAEWNEGYEEGPTEKGHEEDVGAAWGLDAGAAWQVGPATASSGPAAGSKPGQLPGRSSAERGAALREALGQLLAQHHEAVRQVILEHAVAHDLPLPELLDPSMPPPSLPLPPSSTNGNTAAAAAARPPLGPSQWQPQSQQLQQRMSQGSPAFGTSPMSYGSDASSLSLSHLGALRSTQSGGVGGGGGRDVSKRGRDEDGHVRGGSSGGGSGESDERRAAELAAPGEDEVAADGNAAASGWQGGGWYYPGATEGGAGEAANERQARPAAVAAAGNPAAAAGLAPHGRWYYPGPTEGGSGEPAGHPVASRTAAAAGASNGRWYYPGPTEGGAAEPSADPRQRQAGRSSGGGAAAAAGPSSGFPGFAAEQRRSTASGGGVRSNEGADASFEPLPNGLDAEYLAAQLLRHAQLEAEEKAAAGAWGAAAGASPQTGGARGAAAAAASALLGLLRRVQTEGGVAVGAAGSKQRKAATRAAAAGPHDNPPAAAAEEAAARERRRTTVGTAPPASGAGAAAAVAADRFTTGGGNASDARSNASLVASTQLPGSSSAPEAVRSLNDALVQQLLESTRLQVQMQRALDAALEQLSTLQAREQQQHLSLPLPAAGSQLQPGVPSGAQTDRQPQLQDSGAYRPRERAISAPAAAPSSPQRPLASGGGQAAGPSVVASPRLREAATSPIIAAEDEREARRRSRSAAGAAAPVAGVAVADAMAVEGGGGHGSAVAAVGDAGQDAAAADALRAALHMHHQRWRVKKAKYKEQVQAWQYTAWRYATAWKRARAALQALVSTQGGGGAGIGPISGADSDALRSCSASPPPAAAPPPRDFRPLVPGAANNAAVPSSNKADPPALSPRHKSRRTKEPHKSSSASPLSSPRLLASLAAALQCRDQPLCAWAPVAPAQQPEAAADVLRATAHVCTAAASAMDSQRARGIVACKAGGNGSAAAAQGGVYNSPRKSHSKSPHKHVADESGGVALRPADQPVLEKGKSPVKVDPTACDVESLCRCLKSLSARDATVAALCAYGMPPGGTDAATDLGRLRDQAGHGRSRSAERRGGDAAGQGPMESAAHWPATLRSKADSSSRPRSVSPSLGQKQPWRSAGTHPSTPPGGGLPRPHRHDSASREPQDAPWSDCAPLEELQPLEQSKSPAVPPAPPAAPPGYRDPHGWWNYPDGWIDVHPRPPHMLVQQANTKGHHRRYPHEEHKRRNGQ